MVYHNKVRQRTLIKLGLGLGLSGPLLLLCGVYQDPCILDHYHSVTGASLYSNEKVTNQHYFVNNTTCGAKKLQRKKLGRVVVVLKRPKNLLQQH